MMKNAHQTVYNVTFFEIILQESTLFSCIYNYTMSEQRNYTQLVSFGSSGKLCKILSPQM